ncbi:MAG: hypothetical protein JWM97_2704 [Phycisphaerales bacterium]|nr:hypothetical protein [Phycisphaerales bacterium]
MALAANPELRRARIGSIDLLRGAVMVLMALDHTRYFISNAPFDPTDIAHTTAPYFLTRWVTHFCAPVFVFLAGVGAFLSQTRGRTKSQTAYFLWTRGVLLIALECTLVRLGGSFNPDLRRQTFQVFWVLGCSMIALSVLMHLPPGIVGAFGLALVLGHNLFDGVRVAHPGAWHGMWTLLHQPGDLRPGGGIRIYAEYALVPWVGVMALGYACGPVYELDSAKRRRLLLCLGAGLIVAFITLRALSAYGDPHKWAPQRIPVLTAIDFLNCTKYPPSLLYLLMTLGPGLMALGLAERPTELLRGRTERMLIVFGRVPLFFYLLHRPLIHCIAVALSFTRYGPQVIHFSRNHPPADVGYGLPVVYGVWLVVVAMLYPPCRRFEQLKRTRRSAWLAYL